MHYAAVVVCSLLVGGAGCEGVIGASNEDGVPSEQGGRFSTPIGSNPRSPSGSGDPGTLERPDEASGGASDPQGTGSGGVPNDSPSSSPDRSVAPPAEPPAPVPATPAREYASCTSAIPAWYNYPGQEWTWLNAERAGLNPSAFASYTSASPSPGSCGGDIHSGGRWGTCVQRGGYMLHCWGDENYVFNSASVGKAFNGFALQLAIDLGIVTGDERVCDLWPDCPSACGSRSTLRNLFLMRGGFATSNGYQDGCDNTQCVSSNKYSSGGQWRLNQALTYILGTNLKDFLDEELFGYIGIDPNDWYWMTGEEVNANMPPPNSSPDQTVLYPSFTAPDRDYGCFVDPPYQIRGHDVYGGGGWVGMSPKDLARIGLLLASGGCWDGEQLITKTELVDGHAGCGGSDLRGDPSTGFAWGRVATNGVSFPTSGLVVGPILGP